MCHTPRRRLRVGKTPPRRLYAAARQHRLTVGNGDLVIALSVLLLAAAAVMIPFGLASDQGDGLIWASVACTALALVLLAVGLRRQARSGKLASVPPWALPADEPAPPAAADTARIDAAPATDEATEPARRPSTTKRVGVKRAPAARAKKAGGTKAVAKKTGGAKKAATKRAAGTKAASAKKTGTRRASAAKKR